jgi:hypothetical protein
MIKTPISKQELPSPFHKSSLFNAVLLASAAFLFYFSHSAPGVTVEDSGDFHLGARTLGTIHPPGYPLYTMLAFVAARVPFVNPTLAVNLLSGLFMALSAGLLFLILNRTLKTPKWLGWVTGATFAVHPVIWSQGVVAEVYGLNIFLITLTLWLGVVYLERRRPLFGYLIWFLIGLGLANHYPLFILALSGFGVWALYEFRPKPSLRHIGLLALLSLGLSPYLLLIINATLRNPTYNFGKLSDLSMVWEHIMRFHYRGIDEAGGTLFDKFSLMVSGELRLLMGFLLFAPLIAVGIWRLHKDRSPWRWPLMISTLSVSAALALLLGFPDNERYQAIFLAYLGPAVLFHAMYLAAALDWFRQHKILPYFVALALAAQVWHAYPQASHRGDSFVADWGRAVLNSLAPNSILVLCGTDVFAVYYVHFAGGVRPDVTLYDRFSVFTRENLFAPQLLFQSRNPLAVRETRERQLADSPQPVYYLCPEHLQELKIPYSPTLYAFRVTSSGGQHPSDQLDENLFRLAMNGLPKNEYWLDKRRIVFLYQAVSFAAGQNPELLTKLIPWIAESRYLKNHEFVLALAKPLTSHKRYSETIALLIAKEKLVGLDDFHPEELGLYCGLELAQQNFDKAEGLCLKAVAKATMCSAASHLNLALIYRQHGKADLMREHAQAALTCNPQDAAARQLLGQ